MATRQGTTTSDEAGSAGGSGRGEGRAASVIGVLGAGTMGNGIAQLAARSGARTLLYDPFPEALEKGAQNARKGLAKEAEKGKLTEEQAKRAAESLSPVDDMAALSECELVIEAAPERLELKHEMYGKLSEIVSEECVLASNTSSLLVTAIARGATCPERVVGMHFFNPAPLMALLEVVAGVESSPRAIALALATGAAMGKTTIVAKDGPGFIVNRCNRPFGLEALRLLQERISDVETIDRICRLEGGFRMGPFELMDLVGVDTGLEISESFYAQSYGEPRWRPSTIAARQVAAGLYGRKSGRGYYDYGDGAHRPQDPEPPTPGAPGQGEGVVVICGEGAIARELREAARAAGFEARTPHEPSGGVLPALFVDCDARPVGRDERASVEAGVPDRRGAPAHMHGGAHLLLCASGSLSMLDPGGSAVGFHFLPPFERCALVELTRNETSSPLAAARAERFFAAIGRHVEWVGDAPGLALGRIVCQVINESAFALGEGVGSAQDIDTGMVLGLGHPRGPLEWADMIGLDHVLTVLGALGEEYREERYRPAPALRALVAAGRLGRSSGAGFFDYED